MNDKKLKVYAIYRGDEFIAVGTVDELAQLMHTNKLNIRSSIWHKKFSSTKHGPKPRSFQHCEIRKLNTI